MPPLLAVNKQLMSTFLLLTLIVVSSTYGCKDTRPPTVNPIQELSIDRFDQLITQNDFQGIVVVFATWCPPCREELPELIDVYEEYKDKDIKIIALSVDDGNAKKVQFLVDDMRLPYPVYHVGTDAVQKYKIIGIPTLLVVQNGRIIKKMAGQQTSRALKNRIEALIK